MMNIDNLDHVRTLGSKETLMSSSNDFEPPQPDSADVAYAVARAGLASIPLAGAAAVELLQLLLTPPLEKRRIEWMNDVGRALRDLETNRGVKLEDLQNDDVFLDAVLQSSQIAIRSSQTEKRQALKNAILNAALPNPPDQSLQQMFLSLVDSFTVWHLKILKLFDNPRTWAQNHNHTFPDLHAGALDAILISAFPELERTFYDQIWRDLYTRGLVNTESLHGMMTGNGLFAKRTSDIGSRFLAFVEEPR
jgi:hypothetical protein